MTARTALQASLLELGKRPQVYVKMPEVLHHLGGQVRHDLDFYRSRLDEIWDLFGPDRLLYGSDWPNSDHSAPLWQELRVVREYIDSKSAAVAEKFLLEEFDCRIPLDETCGQSANVLRNLTR